MERRRNKGSKSLAVNTTSTKRNKAAEFQRLCIVYYL